MKRPLVIMLILAVLSSACTNTEEEVVLAGTWISTQNDGPDSKLEFRSDNTVWWWYYLGNGSYMSPTGKYSQKGKHIEMNVGGYKLNGDYLGIDYADIEGDEMRVSTYSLANGLRESFVDTYKKKK